MGRYRWLLISLAALLAWTWIVLPNQIHVNAAIDLRPRSAAPESYTAPLLDDVVLGATHPRPALSNEAYIRPAFKRQMRALRPAIIAAAQRHNRPLISGMSDQAFAVVIATLLYNENFGWFEEEVSPIRSFTPLYESLQVRANGIGANLSVWPANLRPSVAAEILEQRIPVPAPTNVITRAIEVSGSTIDPAAYANTSDLYAAITKEIATPRLAVEYLAANLERGLYRAAHDDVAVTWRTLAAWHNQGIVAPREIVANPTAASYVRRASAYLPAARRLIEQPAPCQLAACTLAEEMQRATEWVKWQ